ncbi:MULTISPECIES: hypothetical protein [Pimelobacter]|uniref:hypothetical protein n=1 Tax=Pimelobacter TaxID=2044 RepID=UPI001C04C403|nr:MULTISPECIES: hypothetical protein [Pimelobacter]MBU2698854.1 hypothetical protein [Pimelobacter sp. 30-1]UUW92984.1 hypothetical protein M0M43_30590 [Pimelobacter simplex]UUW99017.1 hypothetical protein M0M48_30610 [Pimelobacter simplex]
MTTTQTAETTEATVTLKVRIENYSAQGEEVLAYETATVPALPRGASAGDRQNWFDDHLFALTGTGQTTGDWCYFLTIVEASDEALIGQSFEWL